MRAEGIQSKLTFSFIIIQNTQRMLILSLFMKFFNKPFLASFQYTINYTIYNQVYFFIPVYLTYFFVCVKQLHKYNFVNLSHFNDLLINFIINITLIDLDYFKQAILALICSQ